MIAKNVLCIVNPVSGWHDSAQTRWLLDAYLTKAGIAYLVRETVQAGDTERWAQAARNEGFDAVLVCGGDGSVTEALTGLLKDSAMLPLALLPVGTGNLVAKALAIPAEPAAALKLLSCGKVIPLDVAYLPERQRYFVLIAGAGWGARLIEDAPHTLKRQLGSAAYLVAGIKNLFSLRRTQVTLTLDGMPRQIVAHTVLLANFGQLRGLALGPGISPHDGKLDVIVFSASGLSNIAGLLWRFFTGRLEGHAGLSYYRAASVRIAAASALPVQLDGEPMGETPLCAEILPGRARMLVPTSYLDDVSCPVETSYPADSVGS